MKKIIKTAQTLGLVALPFLALATKVYATGDFNLKPTADSGFSNLGNITFPGIVQAILTLALVITGLVALGFLIYGGIAWITSGGDKAKTETARNTITAALIGLLIVFGAWALMQLIEAFFGVSILTGMNIPTVGSVISPE